MSISRLTATLIYLETRSSVASSARLGFGRIRDTPASACCASAWISVVVRSFSTCSVPADSPSRGGDVAVYVLDINQPSLPTLLILFLCVCFCLYDSFNCISFHEFSRQLSAFSLSSSGLISAFLVLSAIYLFMKVSLSPDKCLCG